MPRYNGGFIGTDGLDAPDPPTGVTPTAGSGQVSVAFTAPTDTGTSAITGFVAQVSSSSGDYSAGSNTGTSSPIVVSSLTDGTAYTAKVWAINAYGTSAPSDASSSFTPSGKAFWHGGATSGDNRRNDIQTISFSTLGNATDYGDITATRFKLSGCSSSTRGLTIGGRESSDVNTIDYYDLTSSGNASDFGDLTGAVQGPSALANSTRGVRGGGETGTKVNVMDYVTIGSTGNATDFGDLTQARMNLGSAASSTRGLFAGGADSSTFNIIDYITIGSTGNALDFGDLTVAGYHMTGCSNSTRALFGPGTSRTSTIDYVTIASTGNATDFGDPSTNRNNATGAASATRAVFGGSGNTIDYVTIASTGNAQDFGDLTFSNQANEQWGACSTSHGGLS